MNLSRRKIAGLLATAAVVALGLFAGLSPAGATINPNPGGACIDEGFTIGRGALDDGGGNHDGGSDDVDDSSCETVECTGEYSDRLRDARRSYKAWCGQRWRRHSDLHKCEWHSNGWICAGPKTATPDSPDTPSLPDGDIPLDI